MTLEEISICCFQYENRYRMNKLGIFLLDEEEIKHIDMSENEKSMYFGMISNKVCLSRGRQYYCDKMSINHLDVLQRVFEQAVKYNYHTIVYAINENLLNKIAAIWYCFKYNNKLQNDDIILQLHKQMKNMVINLINALTNNMEYIQLDWFFLRKVIANLEEQMVDYRVPELDNKTTILKELCWLLQNEDMSGVDSIAIPMFGSVHLMLFCEVMLQMFNHSQKCYPINIGFHDRKGDTYRNGENINVNGEKILVLDDNIGTGSTIKWCKNRIIEKEKKCIARVCEIPWDVLVRMQRYEVISENLDLPTIKSNFRVLSKNIFIQSIVAGDYHKIFCAKQLYSQVEKELCNAKDRIINLRGTSQFSERQVETMISEYEFYEKIARSRE